MPRNSSGTYTLPAGNPVVSGTLIEASWANTTLSDLASAMTNSLSRGGEGGMTAALRLYDGTVSLPGVAFTSETSTGLYRAGSGDMRLAVTGSQVVQFLTTGVGVTGTLSASGNFAINTDKFTVAASTGNTVVAGTLGVTGAATLSSTLAVTGATTLTGVATLTANPVLSAGTANGVTYLNGSKALTSGAGWTYDGTTVTLASSTAYYPQSVQRNTTADANASYLVLDKNRNGAVVQNGDVLGNLVFRGYDGAAYLQGAYINAKVTATPGTNDMPVDLIFGTTPDGAAGPSERFRFGSAGQFGIGGANYGTSGQVLTSAGSNAPPTWSSVSGATSISNGTSNVTVNSSGGSVSVTTAGTTAMTIDTSQNLGIGTTSPSYKLDIQNGTARIYNSTYPSLRIHNSSTGTASNDGLLIEMSGSDANFVNYESANMIFKTADTERMRIDSSGYVLVGCTAYPSSSVAGAALSPSVVSVNPHRFSVGSGTGVITVITFVNGNGIVGAINTSGSNTVYSTSSDYRLKENIAPMTGALGKVQQLKPCTYTWKSDGSNGQGFIAHELGEVFPDAVIGEKDALDKDGSIKAQGIDTSFLVATLTAAIQELKAINDTQAQTITALTARIEALESTP